MMRLGRKQRDLLMNMANPWLILIVGNQTARSLERKGLLVARGEDGDSIYQISAGGLRQVADEINAGTMVFPWKPRLSVKVKGEK